MCIFCAPHIAMPPYIHRGLTLAGLAQLAYGCLGRMPCVLPARLHPSNHGAGLALECYPRVLWLRAAKEARRDLDAV